jgi:GNAT superfamily N-acetyltransferase
MMADIRWSRPQDRDAILSFIQQMGFNPRDSVTWDALQMQAMTAWQGAHLIGAIPLEPRPLRVAPNQSIPTAHETVVALHPDHRAKGIGSAMQRAIVADPPQGARIITVFREDPQSPAYRWYLKNGFTPIMHIDSWFCDPPASPTETEPELYPADDPRLDYPFLHQLWLSATAHSAGFVDRRQRPLDHWLRVHPYRARYQFHILLHRRPDRSIAGYALLGVGQMHSPTDRIDILDLISSDNTLQPLINAIQQLSIKKSWRPIRWPLADQDPATTLAQNSGFEKRWPFDMLARALSPSDSSFILHPSSFPHWRYAPIDYI